MVASHYRGQKELGEDSQKLAAFVEESLMYKGCAINLFGELSKACQQSKDEKDSLAVHILGKTSDFTPRGEVRCFGDLRMLKGSSTKELNHQTILRCGHWYLRGAFSVKEAVDMFNSSDRLKVQRSIEKISRLLCEDVKPRLSHEPVIAPVLRAGMGMWSASNAVFDAPSTYFISASKEKGSSHITLAETSKAPAISGKSVVVLDTVAATGDTLCEVVDHLKQFAPAQIVIMSCYVSPVALRRLIQIEGVDIVSVGVLAQDVDEKGFLVPYTHGDMGDKLFSDV